MISNPSAAPHPTRQPASVSPPVLVELYIDRAYGRAVPSTRPPIMHALVGENAQRPADAANSSSCRQEAPARPRDSDFRACARFFSEIFDVQASLASTMIRIREPLCVRRDPQPVAVATELDLSTAVRAFASRAAIASGDPPMNRIGVVAGPPWGGRPADARTPCRWIVGPRDPARHNPRVAGGASGIAACRACLSSPRPRGSASPQAARVASGVSAITMTERIACPLWRPAYLRHHGPALFGASLMVTAGDRPSFASAAGAREFTGSLLMSGNSEPYACRRTQV